MGIYVRRYAQADLSLSLGVYVRRYAQADLSLSLGVYVRRYAQADLSLSLGVYVRRYVFLSLVYSSFTGDNVIGRHESCNISIPLKVNNLTLSMLGNNFSR